MKPIRHRSSRALSRAVRLTALLAPALAASLPAVAQQTAGGLEEVIVTAQKRAQNSQEIGISLSAISGADLASTGVVNATDVTKSMPAVVLTQPNGPSSFSLAIRGVTQNDFADHQESPAAIYVDDVYVSQMAGLAFSVFDVDRVEVLRGPQGTLFGRNATGGLANFITRRPTSEAGGYVNATFGERNLTRVEAAINGAVSDSVDARLSVQTNHYDPLFKNVAGSGSDSENGNDWAVRGQMLFKLPTSAQLLLIGRASREDVHAGSWEERATKPVGNGVDVFVGPNENFYGTCNGCNASGVPNSGPFTTRNSISGFAKLKTSGLTAKYTQDLGFANLTIVGDYSKLEKNYQEDSDASPTTLFQFFNGSNVKQQSLEARLNGGDKRLNWTAGLYGLRIDGQYFEGWQGPSFFTAQEFNTASNPNNYYGIPGPWPYGTAPYYTDAVAGPNGEVPATKAPYELLTKSASAFAQVEYRFSDLIGFTLGGRFTADKKDYHYTWSPYEFFPQSTTNQIVPLTRVTGLALNDYTDSRSDNLWSGKAQVDFHLSDDVLAYVSYNRGVKGGGYNAPLFPFTINDLETLKFKPETLTSYEVGFKSELLDHKLRLNAAAYYYDYKDYQALIYTIGLEQLILNADATHKGAEAELEWAPNEAWRFGLGLAYVDALVKNVAGRCCDANFNPIYGNYVPGNAPRWTGNALVRYTLPVGQGGHLAFQVDGNYLSRFWFNLSDLPVVEQPGFGLGNVRVNYTPAGGKFEIGTSVENVANKHYGVMGFDNTSINGLAQSYPGAPRWWKVHVNYNF